MQLNKELLELDKPPELSSAEARVNMLTNLIKRYKKYDKKRSELLDSVQSDLDFYSDMYLTMKDKISDKEAFEALQERIKALKTNCRALAKQNEAFRKQIELIKDKQLLQDSLKVIENYDIVTLKKHCSIIDKRLSILRKDYDKLLYKFLQSNLKKDLYNNNLKTNKDETQN